MNTKNQLIKTIDLNKHKDTIKYSWEKNQEGQIELILIREFSNDREYEINEIPRINVKELSILGYKNPKKAIESLVNRGVVKQKGDVIELITDQVYCTRCDPNYKIFIWDKENHLKTFHHWREGDFKHYVTDLEFSDKPQPDKINHDYKVISQVEDNKLEVKCKNCGGERTIYIDNYRNECNPNDTSIYIENPDDETDIKVKIYTNHTEKIFKNQEELKRFIQSKIEENI